MEPAQNPFRKYHEFRPRQAMRGQGQQLAPANRGTVALFNNSSGPVVLVIRNIEILGTAADTIQGGLNFGSIGGVAGVAENMVTGDAAQAGVITKIDTATAFAFGYVFPLQTNGVYQYEQNFPFAILLPGWSYVIQDQTIAHALSVSWIWEAIAVNELDYFN